MSPNKQARTREDRKSSELEKLETMHKHMSTIIRRKQHFEVVREVLKDKLADAMEKHREKIAKWDARVCVKRALEKVLMTYYLRNNLKNEENTWARYFSANSVMTVLEINEVRTNETFEENIMEWGERARIECRAVLVHPGGSSVNERAMKSMEDECVSKKPGVGWIGKPERTRLEKDDRDGGKEPCNQEPDGKSRYEQRCCPGRRETRDIRRTWKGEY